MKKEKLINARKAKKISQTDIATYLKISQTQYQKRESGKIKITDLEWKKISTLLDVEIEDIKDDDTKFSFQFDYSTFHDHSGSNITYSNIPDFFLEVQKKYLEKLEKENENLLKEIKILKFQQK